MISLTNYDFQWARSELVIIYPDQMISYERVKNWAESHDSYDTQGTPKAWCGHSPEAYRETRGSYEQIGISSYIIYKCQAMQKLLIVLYCPPVWGLVRHQSLGKSYPDQLRVLLPFSSPEAFIPSKFWTHVKRTSFFPFQEYPIECEPNPDLRNKPSSIFSTENVDHVGLSENRVYSKL